jgi:hypothetical protein
MRGNFRRDRHQHLIDDFGARLRADLEMRRHAPDGKEHTPTAYVFGDACGGKVGSIRRAWDALRRRLRCPRSPPCGRRPPAEANGDFDCGWYVAEVKWGSFGLVHRRSFAAMVDNLRAACQP